MDYEFINNFKSYHKVGNAWCDLHPFAKFLVCFFLGLTPIYMLDWRYGLPFIAVIVAFAMTTGRFKQFIAIFGRLFIILAIFVTVIRQISSREGDVTPLFNIFGWQWYVEALDRAWDRITFITGFSAALLVFFVTTPMRDLMYCLEQIGVSHETSFIMLASMQNIVDLKATSVTILESQKSRGIETDGNVLVRAKAFFPILAPLMLGAISSTEEKSIAMDARAFSVQRQHTFIRKIQPMTGWEKAFIAVFGAYNVALLVYALFIR